MTYKDEKIISKKEIIDLFNNISIVEEPEIPFPQFDVMDEFVSFCEELYNHSMSKEELMASFNIENRHYAFFTSAMKYLGIFELKEGKVSLNSLGKEIFSLNNHDKYLELTKLILQHKPFSDVFTCYVQTDILPNSNDIFIILLNNQLYNLNSEVTIRRRSSTVRNWIRWIINLFEEIE